MTEPVTLREKLTAKSTEAVPKERKSRSGSIGVLLINVGLLTLASAVTLWWLAGLAPNDETFFGVIVVLGLLWVALAWVSRPQVPRRRAWTRRLHFLLAGDRQGFMGGLRLDAKTAVIDGSNLYHFGLDEGEGTRVLRLMVESLRAEGYRVVCFFDANIFHTLQDNGVFPAQMPHRLDILTYHFGLKLNEIYIVPSGVQADKYILSTLSHLPTSFAVTNDLFRDYGKSYGAVMKGDQWRKGVVIRGNELRLLKYRFKTPIRLNAAGSR